MVMRCLHQQQGGATAATAAAAMLVLVIGVGPAWVGGSESPERECCDPVYPLLTPTASTPVNPTSLIPTLPGPLGPNAKNTVAILNCLVAKQLCKEDASCTAILHIIPRLCGLEQVACSTITVTKCQAALRTLQGFPFFRPTCLCREPSVDPECNHFRDSLFDHPCIFVLKKDKDPYPVEALPTCNHAYAVCQQEADCLKLYDDFKASCKVRDGVCKMENREGCYAAWTAMRVSPLFGCICPNNHMKRRCDRLFTSINHNACVGQDGLMPSDYEDVDVDVNSGSGHAHPQTHLLPPLSLSSTCHLALNTCINDRHCAAALMPVLRECDNTNNGRLDNENDNGSSSSCHRENCMLSLHNFYRTAEIRWSLEIAFCLCKKTDNKRDECLIAQEKLHPVCAQRVDGPMPECHSLAESCREDRQCRAMLEDYEQACAVDSVTKKCAGSTSGCRRAMLGILGTQLRSTCACKGTDFSQLYDCLGWQRLLWVNPCVVESQKDYHMKRGSHHIGSHIGHHDESRISRIQQTRHDTPAPVFVTAPPVATTAAVTTSAATPSTTLTTIRIPVTLASTTAATTTPTSTTTPSTTTASTTTTTTTTTTTSTTTTTTTTTTPPPTTNPPKYCMFQREQEPPQYIIEGGAKRIYKEQEPECSDICQCHSGEQLECKVVCITRAPCRTEFAFYNHAAPAYQAYRGRCMCYSGRFICMRPHPDHYAIPHGIFLFVGYSEEDETKLKPFKNLSVQDAVESLQQIMSDEETKRSCTLEIYNMTRENIILIAHPARASNSSKSKLTTLGKDCIEQLQNISMKINNGDTDVTQHMVLSMLKLAEVEMRVAHAASAASASFACATSIISALILLTTFTAPFTTASNPLWHAAT